MGLTCECGDFDSDWYWQDVSDYKPLNTKRSRKCCSCGDKIRPGDTCISFDRYRAPSERANYIEERIYGDEVPLPDWFMCERCADLFNSLSELGFCIGLGQDMRELAREYAAVYGPKARRA